jgi:hypothetical protein
VFSAVPTERKRKQRKRWEKMAVVNGMTRGVESGRAPISFIVDQLSTVDTWSIINYRLTAESNPTLRRSVTDSYAVCFLLPPCKTPSPGRNHGK